MKRILITGGAGFLGSFLQIQNQKIIFNLLLKVSPKTDLENGSEKTIFI